MKLTVSLVGALFVTLCGVGTAKAANAADCAREANALGWSLKVDQIIDLCAGAESTAPVACAKAANDLGWSLSVSQIIQLCRGAVSDAPASCAKDANALGWSLTVGQIVKLCAPVTGVSNG